MKTIRGQILVSRTDDDPSPPPAPPYVRPKRPRVHVQNVPVYAGITPASVTTCGRRAGTHGDVLNVHTGAFLNPHTFFSTFSSVPQHTKNTHTHQTHITTTTNTTITTTHTTQHNTQQQREKEDRERRQEKTRQRDRETERQRHTEDKRR